MTSKAPADALLGVDETDPNASTPCKSLRISYKDPQFGDRLTEDVFLDPRDSLLGDGSVLLVNAAGVTALQTKSDREQRWAQSAQAVINSCRRDYLREQQYLLDELRRLAQSAPKAVEKDIHELMDSALRFSEDAAEDPSKVANPADIQYLSELNGGRRTAEDDELMHWMGKMGLDQEDDLAQRMLLQRIRADTSKLMIERQNLRDAVDAMEGNDKSDQENLEMLIEAMLREAEESGASIKDIIDALLGRADSPEVRQAIEDAVTRSLRNRYSDTLQRFDALEPKANRWRDTLAKYEMKQARHLVLTAEVRDAELELESREEAERRRREAEEALAAIPQPEPEEEPVDQVMEKIMDKLPTDEQAKIKDEQYQVTVSLRRADKLKEELLVHERTVEQFEEQKESLGARIEAAEYACATAQDEIAESEEQSERVKERIRRSSILEVEAKQRREVLEDELAAARKPPPKEKDNRKLEQEVEQTRMKNEELKEQEARLIVKEQEYEERYIDTENAWKAYEEEEAALALMEEQRRAERAAEQAAEQALLDETAMPVGREVSDPLLVNYPERICLPEYSRVSRFGVLHADSRARDRRLGKVRRGVAEDESEQLLARMRNSESREGLAVGSGPKSRVPVNFRRPEDLKVRLEGAKRNVGQMTYSLVESGARGAQLAEDLRQLGRQLCSSAEESAQVHVHVPRRLADFLGSAEAPAGVLREELLRALQRHQVCVAHAEEAWRQAQLSCTRGASEHELELEQEACARCEDDLLAAVRELYGAAARAAGDGPGALASLAKGSCEDWDKAEPQLVAGTVARSSIWTQILGVAAGLALERVSQAGLSRHLQAEEKRRSLLDAERVAPAEARRALAAMRVATATTSKLSSVLLE